MQKTKTGRNDLCPCGSGKKHKKCCLSIEGTGIVDSNIRLGPPEEFSESESFNSDYKKDIPEQINLPEKFLKGYSENEIVGTQSLERLLEKCQELIKNDKYDELIPFLNKSLEISEKIESIEAEIAIRLILDNFDKNGQYVLELLEKNEISDFYFSEKSFLDFDYFMLTALLYKKRNFIKDALYYFEEAYDVARKSGNTQIQKYSLREFGKLLNKSKNYNDAKIFYNFIFNDRSVKYDFSCSITGKCCNDFKVNITSRDVLRIMENRPDLKIEDFINFSEDSSFSEYLSSTINNSDKDQ